MSRLRRLLAAELKDLETTEYDPDQHGEPPPSFDWSLYDLLILTQELDIDDGLGWLKKFRGAPGFPPTLFLASEADVYVAAAAIKLGAGDFLLKDDVTPECLFPAIRETLRRHRHAADADTWSGLSPRATPGLEEAAASEKEPELSPEDYAFTRLIGQGAMSKVFLAKRVADGQLVVVKTVDRGLLADAGLRKRFTQEAEIACSVSSDHMVKTFNYHISEKYGMISMEFLPGGDLKRRMQNGITPEKALDYTRQIAAGVGVLWTARIVHRDLKPGNIMFRANGQLAIADFGIAKRLNVAHELTVAGKILGTPGYMSPEQVLGRDVDTRSDLYAVGVMLYEMLTGERPFNAKSAHSIMYQHVHSEPPKLPATLAAVQPVLDRLLAKEPPDRFEDANALRAALDQISLPAAPGPRRPPVDDPAPDPQ